MKKLDPKKHPKLVKFLERLTKVLNIIAIVCFSVVIVLFACFMSLRGCQKEVAAVSASAESTNYESFNLNLIEPFNISTSDSGVTYTGLFEDGSFRVSGSSSVRTYIFLLYFTKSTLPSGTYTLSFNEVEGISFFIEARNSAGNYYGTLINGCGSFEVDYNGYTQLVFSVLADPNIVYNDVKLYPMLNKGSTAYPFIPHLDFIYNQGYDAADYEYELGYLRGATVSGTVSYYDNNTGKDGQYVTTFNNLSPVFSYNSLSLKDIWKSYELYQGDSDIVLDTATITINFATPFYYSAFPIYFIGDSVVTNGTFVLPDGSRYAMEIPYYKEGYYIGEARQLCVSSSVSYSSDFLISSIEIRFPRAADTMCNASFVVFTHGYTVGYDDGYSDGLDDGTSNAVMEYKDLWYDYGYSDGFQAGFNSTKNGGFSWLISSVQAFLAFNFFGDFGIGTLLYVGLGMVLVTMFLKMFAGG